MDPLRRIRNATCEIERPTTGRTRLATLAAVALIVVALGSCSDTTGPEPAPVDHGFARGLLPEVPTVCSPVTGVDLVADEGRLAGSVEISNDDESLYVAYRTSAAWPIRKTALFVGDAADDIPTSGGGNPIVGRFPNDSRHGPGTTQVVWEIDLDAISGDDAVVAAFAEVGDKREGAWAAGTPITPGGSWATFAAYEVSDCITETIGSGGGSLELPGITLDVPEGALTQDVAISITPIPVTEIDVSGSTASVRAPGESIIDPDSRTAGPTEADIAEVSGTESIVSESALVIGDRFLLEGTGYRLSPDGLQFEKPVEIAITYDDDAIPAEVPESLIRIFIVNAFFSDPGANPVLVDEQANTVRRFVDHFSDAVVGGPNAVADLEITLAAQPDPATVGGDLTHTLVVTNHGPDDVTDVRVSLVVDGDVDIKSPEQEGCTDLFETSPPQKLLVDCPAGDLASGGSETLSLVVVPNVAGQTLTSTARIDDFDGAEDPDAANNSAVEGTDVDAAGPASVDLAVQSLIATPNPARIDDDVTIDLVVENTGDPDVTLPAGRAVFTLSGTTFLRKSISAACEALPDLGPNNEVYVMCDTGELGSGETAAFDIVLSPLSGTEFETLNVAAEVFPEQTSGFSDPDETNDTAEIDVPFLPNSSADLRMRAFGPGTLVQAGFTHTISATVESKPESVDAVEGIIRFDFPDAGTTLLEVVYDQLPADCEATSALSSTGINCAVGTLSPGDQASRTVTVRPLAARTYPVSATGYPLAGDPTPEDNDQAGAFVAEATEADFRAAITSTASAIDVGDTETFSAFVQNLGGDQLPRGTLRIEIEGDSELVEADPACDVVPISSRSAALNCPLPQLASGESSQVFELTVEAVTGGIDMIGHAILLLPDYVDDPDESNNSDEVTVAVNPTNLVDFAVDQFNESADPAQVFESITYSAQAVLESASAPPIDGAEFVLRVEGDVEFESQGDSGCSTSALPLDTGWEMTCALGSYVVGEVKLFSLTVSAPTAPQTLDVTAGVVPPAGYVDTDGTNDQVTATTSIEPLNADLNMSLVLDDPDPVDAGQVVRYETFAQNTSSSDDVSAALVRFLAHGDAELVAMPSGTGVSCTDVDSGLADVAVLCDIEPLRSVDPRHLVYDIRALSGPTVDVEVEIFPVTDYTSDPDPTNNLQTQQTTVNDAAPSLTGTLTYASNRANFTLPQLYTEDLATDVATRINDLSNWADPQWSPDGTRIAAANGSSLWTMTATGGDPQELLLPESIVAPGHPTWSPDGTRIAFHALADIDDDRSYDIYVFDLATASVARLMDNAVDERDPDWSPDGTSILFAREGDGLRTIAPDGTNDTPLLTGIGPVAHPDWSPDGSRVAFTFTRATGSSIEVVSVSNPTAVTTLEDDGRFNQKPAWSPDGQLIAFSKSEFFDEEAFMIWFVPADASSPATLMVGAEDDAITDLDVDWK